MMARYFFDTDLGDGLEVDAIGAPCTGHEHARKLAVTALTEVAREVFPKGGNDNRLAMRVRSEDGSEVLSATLDFTLRCTDRA
jgi:hypothetical protein